MAGKIALVTGGASGMGKIIALRLALQDAKVAIFDLNDEGMHATAAENNNIITFNCDISSKQSVDARVAEVTAQLGPVDHLVHAAALMPSYALADHGAEDVMRLLQINFAGTVYMIKAVLPSMLARDSGTIVAFGSIAGHAMVPKMGAYCATKSAVNTYVETLQNELRKTNLNIHLICPPAVNTPLIDQTINSDAPGSILEAKKSGRPANPEKIIDAIDKGIAKGKDIIYPGEARFLKLWHGLFPGLWWKVVMKFEQ